MMILAGLGNYEPKYLRNRHNVGFMALDVIAHAWSAGPWRKRFQSQASEHLGTCKNHPVRPWRRPCVARERPGTSKNVYRFTWTRPKRKQKILKH